MSGVWHWSQRMSATIVYRPLAVGELKNETRSKLRIDERNVIAIMQGVRSDYDLLTNH